MSTIDASPFWQGATIMPRLLTRDCGAGGSLAPTCAITWLALCVAFSAHSTALAQTKKGQQAAATVREGRIYNLTPQPFTFQLHRADGVAWTDGYVVQPGKYIAIKAPRPGETTEIQGLTGNGRGYVIIRHREPVLGGYMTLRLPAQNPANQQLQPTWFAVKDANGIARLVQEASVEQAQAVQDSLQKQTPMTPEELERSKHMLRANWVLTD
jgi:hypothetical protein